MAFQRSEIFLILVIILFFSLSLLFLILLVISRLTTIQRLKKKSINDSTAGKMLFSVMFENKTFGDLSTEKKHQSNLSNKFFREALLDSVIKLHKSYTGEYSKRIETFYYDSLLIEESYKKLRSRRWSQKCYGIRELAEMNASSSIELIAEYTASKKTTLRQEAIIAIVKLTGVKGLDFLNDYKETLSDWIQLNLLSIIKNNFPSSPDRYYLSFISSSNISVARFGLRLKAFYEQGEDSLSDIHNAAPINYKSEIVIPGQAPIDSVRSDISFKQKFEGAYLFTFKRISVFSIVLFFGFLSTHIFEIASNKISLTPVVLFYALLNDIYSVLLISLLILPILIASALFGKTAMNYVSWVVYISLIVLHLILSVYFFKAKVPLGSDLFSYSMEDILVTAKAGGGFSFSLISILLLFLLLFAFLAYSLNKSSFIFTQKISLAAILLLMVFAASFLLKKERVAAINEYENYLAFNKSIFFFENILEKYSSNTDFSFNDDRQYYLSTTSDSTDKSIDPNFPFLKHNSNKNTLQPFFNELKKENKPNFVFIILEGMGSDFVGEHAKLGNFNPFLDSLSRKSLFWENALSAGGRTFAALPSIFGSLPYLKQGYLEEGEEAPKANSFFKILECSGYQCQYFTGSNASFDKMDVFLKAQGVEVASDLNKFGKGYTKLPSYAGFSWGYGEKDIFKNYFTIPQKKQPNVAVFFTIANHSPYLISNQAAYVERAKKRIKEVNISAEKKDFLSSYLDELSCMLYSDDALRYFFNEFSKREEFKNTIFILTGDHRAPEIPISFQIDRFRVPIIIYSPLLKRTADFKSIVTHLDITPSLLALLSNSIKQPTENSWVGKVLDTSTTFVFGRQVALMRNKNEFQDFLSNDYFLSGNNLFRVTNDMGLNPIDDENKKAQIKNEFDVFKLKNNQVFNTKKLIPDSILACENFRINKVSPIEKTTNPAVLSSKNITTEPNSKTITLPAETKTTSESAEDSKFEINSAKTKTKAPIPAAIVKKKIAVHILQKIDFASEKGNPAGSGFYFVIGTFGNIKNAENFAKTTSIKKHSNIKLIQNKVTKRFNVFVLKTNKIDDIDEAKFKEEYPGIWILKLE